MSTHRHALDAGPLRCEPAWRGTRSATPTCEASPKSESVGGAMRSLTGRSSGSRSELDPVSRTPDLRGDFPGRGVWMPAPHPPEFRQRAVELARLREKPISQIAKDLGISES